MEIIIVYVICFICGMIVVNFVQNLYGKIQSNTNNYNIDNYHTGTCDFSKFDGLPDNMSTDELIELTEKHMVL